MGNCKVTTPQQRTFVVKAGMTPQDVINAKNATPQQKKVAYAFDNDGVAGYSRAEAKLFNTTAITDKGSKGVSFWRTLPNGKKEETRVSNEALATFKYIPKGYKPNPNEPKLTEAEIRAKYKQLNRDVDNLKFYSNGQLKKEEISSNKSIYWNEGQYSKEIKYAENGDTISSKERNSDYNGAYTVEKEYKNGKLKHVKSTNYNRYSQFVEKQNDLTLDDKGDTLESVDFKKLNLFYNQYNTVKKYQNGRGRTEDVSVHDQYWGSKTLANNATYNGRKVKSIEDVGYADRVKVTELDGKVKYYAKDGTQLKESYALKNPNPSWFEKLCDKIF